jgi:hypothetical protein
MPFAVRVVICDCANGGVVMSMYFFLVLLLVFVGLDLLMGGCKGLCSRDGKSEKCQLKKMACPGSAKD